MLPAPVVIDALLDFNSPEELIELIRARADRSASARQVNIAAGSSAPPFHSLLDLDACWSIFQHLVGNSTQPSERNEKP